MQEILLLSIPLDRLKSEISEAVKSEFNKHHQGSKVESNQDELLSRNQTAQILSVSLPTLHAWTKSGVVKAFRIGSRVRYKRSDIDSALQQINNGNL